MPNLRPATKADAPVLAKISILAGGGTFELLLKGLKRGVSVQDVMNKLCAAADTEYSFNYYQLVVEGEEVLGGVNYISVADRYKLASNINPILQREFKFGWMQLIKFLIRARHLKGMNILKAPKNSLHINDVAIFPQNQGKGLGKMLVEFVIRQAQERKFDYVSLNVWTDNTSAVKFYEKLGFQIAKTASVRSHKYLPHSSAHLMLLSVSSRASRESGGVVI